jgi:hypothetical protein
MDGITWPNLKMMLADAPRYVTGAVKKTENEFLDDFCEP